MKNEESVVTSNEQAQHIYLLSSSERVLHVLMVCSIFSEENH